MGPDSRYKQQLSLERDRLGITGFFSALIHVVIILGVSFSLPRSTTEDTTNSLDIVLLNQPNEERPEDAEFFAQADSAGGGTGDEIASSPLPWKAVPVESSDEASHTPRPEQQVTGAEALLTRESETEPRLEMDRPEDETPPPKPDQGEQQTEQNSGRQRERERLIAQLNNKWQEYQKRPRVMYLSPSTTMHEAAAYMDNWRNQVERIGNLNFPERARTDKLTGSLILEVAINPDGTISRLAVVEPSAYKLLDDAAIRFVQLAAPFDEFPAHIRETTDILHITRTFHFLEGNRVVSTAVD